MNFARIKDPDNITANNRGGNQPKPGNKGETKMLTSIEIDSGKGKIYAEYVEAHAMGGIILQGEAKKDEIIAYCDENLNCPFEDETGTGQGDYNEFDVEFV